MNNLTAKQLTFFEKIKELYQTNPLPSYEEIKNEFNFKSKNSVKQYFDIYKKENLIFERGKNLYISEKLFGAPLMHSSLKAGFASIMDDKIEKRISMDDILNINSPSTFVFNVSGDSMQDIGILDGDYVIIKKQQNANIGDIVLAVIDNEFTLKTYKKDKLGYYLQPENKNYPILRPKFSLSIFGVALGITRRF